MAHCAPRFGGVAACLLAAALFAHPAPSGAAVIYVKADAGGANDGSSWFDAYTDLQTAIAAAAVGYSIWVARGTYKPTSETDRAAAFLLKNGVALIGGFAGAETSPSQRMMRFHKAVLSGEIGTSKRTDNSYHVLRALDVDSTAVLDGFLVTGGYALGTAPHDVGGGLTVVGGNPTVKNVWFDRNAATKGGGASFWKTRATLANTAFTRNFAQSGGALCALEEDRAVIVNATFAGDTAYTLGAAIYNVRSHPLVVNSVLWDNVGINAIVSLGGAVTFCYSDVQGSGGSGAWNPVFGIDCGHNVDVNPLLVSVFNGDFHLRPGSPVIGGGDNTAPGLSATDIDGDQRVIDSAIDMGADEYTDPTGIEGGSEAPRSRIRSVYPNPFNPTVTLCYDLDTRERVNIAVFDVGGRLIRSLHDGVENPGPHRATWDGTDDAGRRVASGVYFIEVRSDAWRDYRKVILVK